MIELFDLFLQSRGNAPQSNTDNRLSGTAEKVRELETRYERLRTVSLAMWQLVKERTGATDADLKHILEQIQSQESKGDGKTGNVTGAMDCPHCKRRVLKSATTCVWCGGKLPEGNAFQST